MQLVGDPTLWHEHVVLRSAGPKRYVVLSPPWDLELVNLTPGPHNPVTAWKLVKKNGDIPGVNVEDIYRYEDHGEELTEEMIQEFSQLAESSLPNMAEMSIDPDGDGLRNW